MTITFTVPGRPLSKGSMRPVISKSTGKPFLKPSNPKLGGWMSCVALFASEAWGGQGRQVIVDGPVWLELTYRFERPKSHFGTGRNANKLKSSAPEYPTGKNRTDVDKMERAVLDALTDIIYRDDSQVVGVNHAKRWATESALAVKVITGDGN